LKRQNIDAVHYNAGFDPLTRREIEDGFRDNRWKCVVATNALGMGIDKPDIRFIVHTQIPESPIHYYQEIGRAGRDGKKAVIILLYTPADKELPEHFIDRSKPPIEHYLRVIERLREKPLGMRGLLRRTNLNRTSIEQIVSDLLIQGIIAEETAGRSKSYMFNSRAPPLDTTPFQRLIEFKFKELAKIIEYAETDKCRLFYLCDYLEDKNVHTCHKCDKCRGRTLSYEPTATWQEKVNEFKTNYFPKIELVRKDQEEQPISERKNKLVNGIAFSYYGFSTVGSTIHRCKYDNGGDFPDFLVEGVLKAYRSYFKDEQFDLMIYVPPTESGNLVEHFAEKLSVKTGIPLSHGLVKTRKSEPQKIYQNFSLKRSNVSGAFRYDNPAEVKGKNILLFDDIYGSGATIKEIGNVMSKLGVNKIAPLVIAKTLGGDLKDDKPDSTVDTVATQSRAAKKSPPFAAIHKTYPEEKEIFQVLKEWRLEKARKLNLPPYCIFHDKTLHNIAHAKPSSFLELLDIKGMGKKTVKGYGEELLALIKECEAKHAEG
jgi:ATP-dependent DNA helicase RecQ